MWYCEIGENINKKENNNITNTIEESELDDNFESINQYISTLWYDLIDEIEINKEMFGIDHEVDDCEAGNMIENIIKEILLNR